MCNSDVEARLKHTVVETLSISRKPVGSLRSRCLQRETQTEINDFQDAELCVCARARVRVYAFWPLCLFLSALVCLFLSFNLPCLLLALLALPTHTKQTRASQRALQHSS